MVDRHCYIASWLVASFSSLYGNIKSTILTSLPSSRSLPLYVHSSYAGALLLLLCLQEVWINIITYHYYYVIYRINQLLHVAIVVIVLYGFIVFFPFAYGYPALSNEQVLSRQWQPLWHLLYHKTI